MFVKSDGAIIPLYLKANEVTPHGEWALHPWVEYCQMYFPR